jgi:predicted esterase
MVTEVSPSVLRVEVETGIEDQPKLILLARLPRPRTDEAAPRRVMAYVTWVQEEKNLMGIVEDRQNAHVAFCEREGLVFLTWNTATLWRSRLSSDQLTIAQRQEQDSEFDRMALKWGQAIELLVNARFIQPDQMLLYGFSRGAHWGQRLALRQAQRFALVHLHGGSSYDLPTRDGGKAAWLLTIGEKDGGVMNAKRFYAEAREREYPIILRMIRGLGHTANEALRLLSLAFFQEVLRKENPSESFGDYWRMALSAAPFVGDLSNEWFMSRRRVEEIPVGQRIPLPDETIARLWGRELVPMEP